MIKEWFELYDTIKNKHKTMNIEKFILEYMPRIDSIGINVANTKEEYISYLENVEKRAKNIGKTIKVFDFDISDCFFARTNRREVIEKGIGRTATIDCYYTHTQMYNVLFKIGLETYYIDYPAELIEQKLLEAELEIEGLVPGRPVWVWNTNEKVRDFAYFNEKMENGEYIAHVNYDQPNSFSSWDNCIPFYGEDPNTGTVYTRK